MARAAAKFAVALRRDSNPHGVEHAASSDVSAGGFPGQFNGWNSRGKRWLQLPTCFARTCLRHMDRILCCATVSKGVGRDVVLGIVARCDVLRTDSIFQPPGVQHEERSHDAFLSVPTRKALCSRSMTRRCTGQRAVCMYDRCAGTS